MQQNYAYYFVFANILAEKWMLVENKYVALEVKIVQKHSYFRKNY